jgi:hypothetical protein
MESLVDMGLPAFAIAESLGSLQSHQDLLLGSASPAPHGSCELAGNSHNPGTSFRSAFLHGRHNKAALL